MPHLAHKQLPACHMPLLRQEQFQNLLPLEISARARLGTGLAGLHREPVQVVARYQWPSLPTAPFQNPILRPSMENLI